MTSCPFENARERSPVSVTHTVPESQLVLAVEDRPHRAQRASLFRVTFCSCGQTACEKQSTHTPEEAMKRVVGFWHSTTSHHNNTTVFLTMTHATMRVSQHSRAAGKGLAANSDLHIGFGGCSGYCVFVTERTNTNTAPRTLRAQQRYFVDLPRVWVFSLEFLSNVLYIFV